MFRESEVGDADCLRRMGIALQRRGGTTKDTKSTKESPGWRRNEELCWSRNRIQVGGLERTAVPIELHCHSLFSVDARGTPEDLVDVAVGRGITAIALTDHNNLGGLSRTEAQAARHGIRFLPGVELDASCKDRSYHFVAIGFDAEDSALTDLVDRNFSVYDGMRIPRH